MKKVLGWLLGLISESKKVRAMVVALLAMALVPLAKKIGLEITDIQIAGGVTVVSTYLLSQGLADKGKEAVKEQAKIDAAKEAK